MTGELHRHQRPDLALKALQRKDGRRIADVAKDDMGLDGKDRLKHGRGDDDSARGVKTAAVFCKDRLVGLQGEVERGLARSELTTRATR